MNAADSAIATARPTAVNRTARLWLVALFAGLCLEALALAVFTPATFMLFAVVGVPVCMVAAGYFGVRALRALTQRGLL